MYLQFTLPSIYSGKYSTSSVATYNFKWAKNIAYALIKSVSLNIGGTKVDTLYGEWLDIYFELASTDEKKTGSILVGNNVAVHTPENAPGQNGVYPHIISGDQHTRFDSTGFNVEVISNVSTTVIQYLLG